MTFPTGSGSERASRFLDFLGSEFLPCPGRWTDTSVPMCNKSNDKDEKLLGGYMKNTGKSLFWAVAAMILSACASGPAYHVNIDSITSTDVQQGRTYVLLPAGKDSSPEDLQFKEFASFITTCTSEAGLYLGGGCKQCRHCYFPKLRDW